MVAGAAGTVQVEIVPWLAGHFGAAGAGRLTLEARVEGPVSLRALLASLAERYPAIATVIVDAAADALFDHVDVVRNGTLLGPHAALDESIAPGDALVFLPAFSGG